jgi:signal transduction histidine kinase
LTLAYFFMEPRHVFDIGVDDAIRLGTFSIVAWSTAALSTARRRAEAGQRETLTGLRAALDTLQKLSGWPLVIGSDAAANTQNILRHGAKAVGATAVAGVWESEDEPWVYVAASGPGGETSHRHPLTDLTPLIALDLEGATLLRPGAAGDDRVLVQRGERLVDTSEPPIHPLLANLLPAGRMASAAFRTENLTGRVYFTGLAVATSNVVPAVEVVAREIGNSLNHLYVADRMRALALREDRLRVSRDLHDGVLQALTGIRLELQDMAQEPAAMHDRLLAAERALATEQRELRRFIDGLKPVVTLAPDTTGLTTALRDLAARLTVEWKTPIAVRVGPSDLVLPEELEQPLKLMVHEAVINALKHGHPSRVAVAVEASEGRVVVTVTDDGRGFPFRGRLDHEALLQSEAAPVSLRDRVAALHGRISIDSGARGARVEIQLPV